MYVPNWILFVPTMTMHPLNQNVSCHLLPRHVGTAVAMIVSGFKTFPAGIERQYAVGYQKSFRTCLCLWCITVFVIHQNAHCLLWLQWVPQNKAELIWSGGITLCFPQRHAVRMSENLFQKKFCFRPKSNFADQMWSLIALKVLEKVIRPSQTKKKKGKRRKRRCAANTNMTLWDILQQCDLRNRRGESLKPRWCAHQTPLVANRGILTMQDGTRGNFIFSTLRSSHNSAWDFQKTLCVVPKWCFLKSRFFLLSKPRFASPEKMPVFAHGISCLGRWVCFCVLSL